MEFKNAWFIYDCLTMGGENVEKLTFDEAVELLDTAELGDMAMELWSHAYVAALSLKPEFDPLADYAAAHAEAAVIRFAKSFIELGDDDDPDDGERKAA